MRLTRADTVSIMAEYDPLAPVPRYRQIAAILRGRIEAGEIERDRPIPSEGQIQEEFGVARETARKAVAVLRDEGLVRTVPGMGTYVR
jgi:DNA-binding GntR family transcriptional regulator